MTMRRERRPKSNLMAGACNMLVSMKKHGLSLRRLLPEISS